MTADQLGETGWQLLGAGHSRPINQDWDDADLARQGGLDLHTHVVIGVIKATPALLVRDCQPFLADQSEQHVAGTDRAVDYLDEVVAELD